MHEFGKVNYEINSHRLATAPFLSHPIMMLTNTLLSHILSNPKATRRLIKWAIEINEYYIEYQPCPVIKAQTLANFLMKIVRKEEHEL